MKEADLVLKLANGRVAVIGDLMVDHYVSGVVGRISPEAPVPVLHVSRERHVLGGAANVAANVAALGGKAELIGVVGDDPMGRMFADLIGRVAGVNAGVHVSPSHPTITKTRYVAGQQQIVRVDRETLAPYPSDVDQALIALIARAVKDCDSLVLSDYGKGALSDAVIAAAIEAAKTAGKPVIVDPKRRTFEVYRGADYITPNRKELAEATGLPTLEDAECEAAAAVAMKQSGAAILVTRSERGMSLFRKAAAPIHLAVEAREVFDVSGAGDTVAATTSLGLATGLPIETAMRMANAAAGVVVGKLGTATCSPDELVEAMSRKTERAQRQRLEEAETHGGVTSLEDAIALRNAWKDQGLSVGFTNGCFDLIHPGHVSLLRQSAAACDRLIVAINTDASVKRLKGESRPVQDEDARARVLSGIKGVDLVIAFDEDTPLSVIEQLKPDLLVKGADYREDQVVGADVVKARGGRVLLVDLVAGQSTSNIVKKAGKDLPKRKG